MMAWRPDKRMPKPVRIAPRRCTQPRAAKSVLVVGSAAAAYAITHVMAAPALAEPAAKAKRAAAKAGAPTKTATKVPLPVRKPDGGWAHPGIHGPRPARIKVLLPPVRFKTRRLNGRIVRREIKPLTEAELIAAARKQQSALAQTKAEATPEPVPEKK